MLPILLTIYQIGVLIVDMFELMIKTSFLTLQATYHIFVPPAPKSIQGEIVLITGAGHGIGRELSLQFARLGAKVVCWDINEANNKSTVDEIKREGGSAFGYVCDVTSRDAVHDVAKRIRGEVGEVSILVNNAGVMPCKPFMKFPPQEVEKLFKLNVFAHFYALQEFLPQMMVSGRGHVVAMSSVAGVVGTPNLVPYCSTKFAVKGLMESLQEELRYGNRFPDIHLTTVHPFVVDTGLAQKPRIRFPSLYPVTPPPKCAEIIIDGVRRNYDSVFVPPKLTIGLAISSVMPRKVQKAIVDFLDTGCDEHDD